MVVNWSAYCQGKHHILSKRGCPRSFRHVIKVDKLLVGKAKGQIPSFNASMICTAAERWRSAAPESGSVADAVRRRLQCLVRRGAPRGLRVGAPSDFRTIFVPPDTRSAPPHRSHRTAYWITSSAWNRMRGGIVIPSALAVLRLITRSNFMGSSTGKSPGLAPFRILWTWAVARRNSSS